MSSELHIKRNGSRGKIGIFWQMKMIELQYETANGLLVKNTKRRGDWWNDYRTTTCIEHYFG